MSRIHAIQADRVAKHSHRIHAMRAHPLRAIRVGGAGMVSAIPRRRLLRRVGNARVGLRVLELLARRRALCRALVRGAGALQQRGKVGHIADAGIRTRPEAIEAGFQDVFLLLPLLAALAGGITLGPAHRAVEARDLRRDRPGVQAPALGQGMIERKRIASRRVCVHQARGARGIRKARGHLRRAVRARRNPVALAPGSGLLVGARLPRDDHVAGAFPGLGPAWGEHGAHPEFGA